MYITLPRGSTGSGVYTNYDLLLVIVWSYTTLHLLTIDVMFYQVKMLMFYNAQPTDLIIVGIV